MRNGRKKELVTCLYICLGLNMFVLFMAITVGKGKNLFFPILTIVLIILNILKMKKQVVKDEIEDGKIVLAEVILVDNFHNPKRLVCQTQRSDGIVYFQKEKKKLFLKRWEMWWK